MKKILLIYTLVFFIALSVLTYSLNVLAKIEQPRTLSVQLLLDLTNDVRREIGLKDLKLIPELNKSAKIKVDDMKLNNYFAHADLNGKQGYDYILEQDLHCFWAGENLVKTSTLDERGIIDGLVNSPTHYENIINKTYDYIGFGISDDEILVAQHFCGVIDSMIK